MGLQSNQLSFFGEAKPKEDEKDDIPSQFFDLVIIHNQQRSGASKERSDLPAGEEAAQRASPEPPFENFASGPRGVALRKSGVGSSGARWGRGHNGYADHRPMGREY